MEWWSGGAVIQSVIPLLSWAVYSSVLCRESRVLQISVLRLLLRSGDMVGALAFVNVSPSKARRARAQPPSCNKSYASRPVATYKIEWGQGYCSGCHASVARALPWALSACKCNTSRGATLPSPLPPPPFRTCYDFFGACIYRHRRALATPKTLCLIPSSELP